MYAELLYLRLCLFYKYKKDLFIIFGVIKQYYKI